MSEITVISPSAAILPGLLGVLVGGLIAIATTYIQLWHARKQSKIEREHSRKLEVYLRAADGLGRGTQYLASFAEVEVPVRESARLLREDPGWLIRVQAVGSLETISAFTKASEYLGMRSLDLAMLKTRWSETHAQLDAVNQRIVELEAYSQQVTSTLQALSGPGIPAESRARIPEFLQDFRSVRANLEQEHAEGRAKMSEILKQHRQLILESIAAAYEYQYRLVPAMVRLRSELGLAGC